MVSEFYFGSQSTLKLETCHPTLQRIAHRALATTPVDFTIVHGFRGEQEQNALYDRGASKLQWPESEHNAMRDGLPCSRAIDFAPWIHGDIPWNDTHLFAMLAGVFFAAADHVGARLRWGGDWDLDGLTTDQTFMDWGHVELVE